ncbi:hypothetical protein MPTA5024_11590 [Microbispora sp. ATCC PTA-5024]|nr:hypothetical protein MPTA5024_11590 [Microbispora sp. ATCC PTA-5024]
MRPSSRRTGTETARERRGVASIRCRPSSRPRNRDASVRRDRAAASARSPGVEGRGERGSGTASRTPDAVVGKSVMVMSGSAPPDRTGTAGRPPGPAPVVVDVRGGSRGATSSIQSPQSLIAIYAITDMDSEPLIALAIEPPESRFALRLQ